MNQPLPPLPLIDNCLFIDNSLIEQLTTCPRLFEYSALHKRIIKGGKSSLIFGSALHLALEWRYKNLRNSAVTPEAENSMMDVIAGHFAANPIPEDDHRTINHARELVKRYNQKYRLEPFSILVDSENRPMVELPFIFPLCAYNRVTSTIRLDWDGKKDSLRPDEIGVFFVGRIDLPVSWDNQIIILDHKTNSMFFGPDRFLEEQKMSNQHLGYCYGFEKLTGQKVGGFCINGLGTKEPPLYVTDPARRTKGQKSADEWWAWMLPRDITYLALLPGWQERWMASTLHSVEYLFWMHRKGLFPPTGMFVRACANYGGCQYKDVCSLEETKGRELLMSGDVYIENDWSPLKDVVKK